MKKLFCLLFVLGFGVAPLVGCGNDKNADKPKVNEKAQVNEKATVEKDKATVETDKATTDKDK
jgi:hypothetical protein